MQAQKQAPGERERLALVRWRRERLRAAGVERALAAALARDFRVDLHAVIGLVEDGCPPVLAARILAPVDEPDRPAC